VLTAVRGGKSLGDAMAEHKFFPSLYVNMVRAGEVGGFLDSALERLADYLERSQDLRREVVTALTYPGDPHARPRLLADLPAHLRAAPVLGPVRGHGPRAAAAGADRHGDVELSCARTGGSAPSSSVSASSASAAGRRRRPGGSAGTRRSSRSPASA
jgi:hypothetical protein